MLSTLLSLAIAPVLFGADESPQSGTLLSYRGSVAQMQQDRTPGAAEKTFDLTLLLAGIGGNDARVYWRVDERGRGAWPWIERFGSVPVDASWQGESALLPSLLYDREDGTTVIPLELPLLAAGTTLAEEATWEANTWTYTVEKAEKVDDRPTWQVRVSNSYGPKRTVFLDQASPLVAAMTEKVFMGMGTEYQLQMRLVGVEQLDDARLRAAVSSHDALLALRADLNRPTRSEGKDWDQKQLALLTSQLPEVEKVVTDPALLKLVRTARKDVESQTGRASAVGRLSAEFEGQTVGPFAVEGASREKLSEADLQGQVTVLHFWDYREPLEEPYGQVGYLDFLYHKHKDRGLKVYGVAVDGRLADQETRGVAVREVKKVKSFMNLSYPVLLDDGALVKQFGDPRLVGAELPLFVVIGPDGTIQHYHVGFYEVDRNEGLKALNEIVAETLKP
jgi:alkyl hydroperoxide reductase subunit AhpC